MGETLLPNWRELLFREDDERCPRCGEPLDTGWMCLVTSNRCGFDASLLILTEGVSRQ